MPLISTDPRLPDVQGIKFGTLANYLLLRNIDADTLYFIIDKGLIYRGRKLITPVNVTDLEITGEGARQLATFTLTYYGDNPGQPITQQVTVYTNTAVANIINNLTTLINNHKNVVATFLQMGHVRLSDAIDDTEHGQNYGETHNNAFAATPKAVADALAAANNYTDQQIAEALQSVHQKGTYGLAADGADESRPLNEIDAVEGDTYICISSIDDAPYVNGQGEAATYDLEPGDNILCLQDAVVTEGVVTTPARWTIVPNMSQNAVITENSATVLTNNNLVVGAGNKKVKRLPNGYQDQMLRMGSTGPQWVDHINADHGIGYAKCLSDSSEEVLEIEIHGFKLVEGAIIAVAFRYGVGRNSSISVNGETPIPISYHNERITDGIVEKEDTATFMYTEDFYFNEVKADAGAWVLISVDKPNDVPTQLSELTNNIQGLGVCNTAAGIATKTATITGVRIRQGSVFAIRFTYDVDSSATLNINGDGAKNILHRNAALAAGQILAGDTVTFISDGISYHVLSIDRPYDQSPTANSHNLVDSNAIYQAIEAAKLKWEEF